MKEIKTYDDLIPSLDLLESRLDSGCEIIKQEGRWKLFDKDGEQVCSGDTIRGMLVNLIFVEC